MDLILAYVHHDISIYTLYTYMYMLSLQDPHYYGSLTSATQLFDSGMVSWRPLDSFLDHSFYNFCLPQLKAK